MNKRAKLQKLIEYEDDIEVVRLTDKTFRIGYCSQCGMCCKTVGMNTRGSHAAIEWLRLHNIDVSIIGAILVDHREEAKEFTLSLTFPCHCKELKLDDEGQKYICNIHTDRPDICKGYPKKVSSHKTCTYVFLDINDLNWFADEYSKYWREKHGQEKKIKLIN